MRTHNSKVTHCDFVTIDSITILIRNDLQSTEDVNHEQRANNVKYNDEEANSLFVMLTSKEIEGIGGTACNK